MIHRLVVEHLRENAHQSLLNTLSISFAVMTMLMMVGTTYKPQSHPVSTMGTLRVTLAAMTWVLLGVAVFFVIINRYSQVRKRTRQFAILKVLGANFIFILSLLLHETMVLVLPGTVAGIILASAATWLITSAYPDLFVLQSTYQWWPVILIIVAVGFLSAGVLGYLTVPGQDLLQELSYEE